MFQVAYPLSSHGVRILYSDHKRQLFSCSHSVCLPFSFSSALWFLTVISKKTFLFFSVAFRWPPLPSRPFCYRSTKLLCLCVFFRSWMWLTSVVWMAYVVLPVVRRLLMYTAEINPNQASSCECLVLLLISDRHSFITKLCVNIIGFCVPVRSEKAFTCSVNEALNAWKDTEGSFWETDFLKWKTQFTERKRERSGSLGFKRSF